MKPHAPFAVAPPAGRHTRTAVQKCVRLVVGVELVGHAGGGERLRGRLQQVHQRAGEQDAGADRLANAQRVTGHAQPGRWVGKGVVSTAGGGRRREVAARGGRAARARGRPGPAGDGGGGAGVGRAAGGVARGPHWTVWGVGGAWPSTPLRAILPGQRRAEPEGGAGEDDEDGGDVEVGGVGHGRREAGVRGSGRLRLQLSLQRRHGGVQRRDNGVARHAAAGGGRLRGCEGGQAGVSAGVDTGATPLSLSRRRSAWGGRAGAQAARRAGRARGWAGGVGARRDTGVDRVGTGRQPSAARPASRGRGTPDAQRAAGGGTRGGAAARGAGGAAGAAAWRRSLSRARTETAPRALPGGCEPAAPCCCALQAHEARGGAAGRCVRTSVEGRSHNRTQPQLRRIYNTN